MNNTSRPSRARRIEIAGNDARSVNVAFGAAIQCVSGKIWLTQEGDSRDYCIPAGVTFCADRSGRAVLSAIDGASAVVVREAGARGAGYVPGTVTVDSMERIDRDARAAQAKALADLVTRALAWMSAALRRLSRARRSPGTNIESAC